MTTPQILILIGAAVIGIVIGYLIRKTQIEKKNREAFERTQKLVKDAEAKAKEVVLDAKREAFKIREDTQKEEQKKRRTLEEQTDRLMKKEETLDTKIEATEKLREELEERANQVKKLKQEVQEIYDLQKVQLEKIASLSQEEAKAVLFKKIEEEARGEIVQHLKKVEEDERKKAKERSKQILAEAIQRYAAEVASETTATTVQLPSDDMKGRIIGKEGRNINAFEQITGVDVIVDDTPGSIVISGFDLIRRYIAKIALERLIQDGRIHPARIEETVQKVKEEVNDLIRELGEKAAYEVSVTGLPPNLIKLLGRLKFRASHGQNVLKHSVEVAFLAAALASEIGANVEVCKKAGLLHDIGKAVDHEVSGHHAHIGRDILKKFGFPEEIIHIVESHHGDPPPRTVEAMVVEAANTISRGRPGATKENLDHFIKRLEEMERLARSFDGVKQVFAMQAGSEVRVFVSPEKVDDLSMMKLAHELGKRIETDLQYPGQVKVNVIRETRGEAFAE